MTLVSALRANEESMNGLMDEVYDEEPQPCSYHVAELKSNLNLAAQWLAGAFPEPDPDNETDEVQACTFVANESERLSGLVAQLTSDVYKADEDKCLGETMADIEVVDLLTSMRETYEPRFLNCPGHNYRFREAFQLLDKAEAVIAGAFPKGTLDRRLLPAAIGQTREEGCPEPCKRCLGGKFGVFECVLPFSARRQSPSDVSEKFRCEKPGWKLLKFRHSVHCRVPEILVSVYQQSHLAALLTCKSKEISMRLKFDQHYDMKSHWRWYFDEDDLNTCILVEQGFAVDSRKFRRLRRLMAKMEKTDHSVPQDLINVFMIFEVTGLAAALGGVRLKSRGVTLSPGAVSPNRGTFSSAQVPAEYIPGLGCDPSSLTNNMFVGVVSEVLALTVAAAVAPIWAPLRDQYRLLMYFLKGRSPRSVQKEAPGNDQRQVRGPGWGDYLGFPILLFHFASIPYQNAFFEVFNFLKKDMACDSSVLLGVGDQEPVCVRPFYLERWGYETVFHGHWEAPGWDPEWGTSRNVTCPDGRTGEARCVNFVTTVSGCE